jgi:hypothetical protein
MAPLVPERVGDKYFSLVKFSKVRLLVDVLINYKTQFFDKQERKVMKRKKNDLG